MKNDILLTSLTSFVLNNKGVIFSLIEQIFFSFTSFHLVSTKASSGVLENVSLVII